MALQKVTIGTIFTLAIAAMSISAISALLPATRTISNTGTIRSIGVGVYSDSGCTSALSTFGWGYLDPGASTNYTIYVKNEGNVPVTLSMTTGNWNPPSASSYINMTWNRQSYVLPAGSVVQALLTLTVSASISGITNFGFDITIIGT